MDVTLDLHLRVTTDEEMLPMTLFKGHDGLVIVREKGGTPDQHYHAYVQGIKKATLDTRVKKLYKGNGQYSNRVCKEPENQLRYLFKGTEETLPVVLVNTLELNVEEKWKEFWEQRKAYKEVKKEALKRQMSFVKQLYEVIRAKQIATDSSRCASTINIVRAALKLSIELDKLPPTDNQMIQYVEYIQLKLDCGNVTQNKIERIVERLQTRNLTLTIE